MKAILLLAVLFLLAPTLQAQESLRPSLLFMVEGQTGNVEATRSGIYKNTDQTITGAFNALLELPAGPKSSILVKAGVGRRVDDISAFSYLGNARITQNYANFGFGVRFFLK